MEGNDLHRDDFKSPFQHTESLNNTLVEAHVRVIGEEEEEEGTYMINLDKRTCMKRVINLNKKVNSNL